MVSRLILFFSGLLWFSHAAAKLLVFTIWQPFLALRLYGRVKAKNREYFKIKEPRHEKFCLQGFTEAVLTCINNPYFEQKIRKYHNFSSENF